MKILTAFSGEIISGARNHFDLHLWQPKRKPKQGMSIGHKKLFIICYKNQEPTLPPQFRNVDSAVDRRPVAGVRRS